MAGQSLSRSSDAAALLLDQQEEELSNRFYRELTHLEKEFKFDDPDILNADQVQSKAQRKDLDKLIKKQKKQREGNRQCVIVRSSAYEEMARDAENVRQAILANKGLSDEARLDADWRLKTIRSKYDDLAAREVSAILEAESSMTAFDIAGDIVSQHVDLIGRNLAKTNSTTAVLSSEDPVFAKILSSESKKDAYKSLKDAKDVVSSFLKSKKQSGFDKTTNLKTVLASYSEVFRCGTVPWCSVHPQKIREALKNSVVSYFLDEVKKNDDSTKIAPSDYISKELDDRITLLSIVLGVWYNDRIDEFCKNYLVVTRNNPNYVKALPAYDTTGSKRLFLQVVNDLSYWQQAYELFEANNK